jgi:mono/diheme cytochrome c family protein
VTAGKPTELGFTLSKKASIPAGTVIFKVTNKGKLAHTFKVCTKPSTTSTANSCTGKVTKLLAPGASTTLTVVFTKKGTYEYLCTVPGHASAGMKGLIGIATKPATVVTPTTTSAAATTTAAAGPKPPATEALVGDPVDGASVFKSAGCGGCHTMAAAGSTGNVGPNLDTIAPDQPAIVTQVTGGGGFMPSFAASLTAQQINDVAAYVYQSTHS